MLRTGEYVVYILEGKPVPKKIRIGIVASRFDEFITSELLSGALDCLRRRRVPEDTVAVAWVPDAFEIPLVTSRMASSRYYNAVVRLGAIIRGSTSHYDYMCSEVSKGIAQTSLTTGVPVIFGVLTTENIKQVIGQAGTRAGNKGYNCAAGAVEVISLIHELHRKTADDNLPAIPPVQNANP